MRIVGGAARRLKLHGPGKVGGIRPTSDKLREALFNMIDVTGGSFLDLFAGTGAVGCEAASRGAARVTMVESSAKAMATVKKNAGAVTQAIGEGAAIKTVHGDAVKFVGRKRTGKKYDWIFCDPPYDFGQSETLISHIVKSEILEPGGTLIWEASKRSLPKTEFEPSKVKSYGDTVLLFYENLP